MRFHRLYRYVCARIFIESRLACLATDINEILYLYLTFFIDARTSVGDIQTVARILWGEGGRGLSKIRACPYFGKCGNLRTVPKWVTRKRVTHADEEDGADRFVVTDLHDWMAPVARLLHISTAPQNAIAPRWRPALFTEKDNENHQRKSKKNQSRWTAN